MKSSLLPLLAATVGIVPALVAKDIPLDQATIADITAAFAKGTLTAEQLTARYLARIQAYDQQGPAINTVITLNPAALTEAKRLDVDWKEGRIRGPLHGVPVILKDNFDTFDLPTTAGSQLLAKSIPPDDAFVVRKLREAGAIILAKVNLSEFAGGGGSMSGATDPVLIKAGTVPNGFSSMGLQTRNPHDLRRGPAGSSGGTGAGLAAVFAQLGLGTDTGGSIRGPAAANGIVGLKPTHGLLSRDGIVPLALTFDTGGPMARSVYDVAVSLGVMAGIDPADPATRKSDGHTLKDYTVALRADALKGARIGVARGYGAIAPETERIFQASIQTLKQLGADVVDVTFPEYMLASRASLSTDIRNAEFKVQIAEYLATLKPGFPRTLDELVSLANDPKTGYRSPEKAVALRYSAQMALPLDHPRYLAAKNQGLAMVTAAVDAVFARDRLDAIVYPTFPEPATLIENPPPPISDSITRLANQTGYPDLIVPAGMTAEGLPVTLSFLGQAFTEAKLLGYGFAFEQATHARVVPTTTPLLPADKLSF